MVASVARDTARIFSRARRFCDDTAGMTLTDEVLTKILDRHVTENPQIEDGDLAVRVSIAALNIIGSSH